MHRYVSLALVSSGAHISCPNNLNTGSGNPCKSPATQVAEIGATFSAHNMQIGRIWLDIEQSSVCGAVRTSFGLLRSFAVACLILRGEKLVELWYGWQSRTRTIPRLRPASFRFRFRDLLISRRMVEHFWISWRRCRLVRTSVVCHMEQC